MDDTTLQLHDAVATFPFDNSYARLPERFFSRLNPTPVKAPELIRFNEALARHLGLDPALLASPDGVQIFSGNQVPKGAAPLAMAYGGHQFGNWAGQLGDGRAILLGEVIDRDGVRRDIQLKGAGRTPFSRGGDGRAALGPVIREYIVSEAMAALGIPTTRALAAVTTGEHIWRETPEQGAVLTRVAQSHVRIGTFEFFANTGDPAGVSELSDYIIARHYPEVAGAGAERPYLAFFEAVVGRVAALVAKWMMVGFIHGVMNTDNMSVAGETIDYGPCAFMDFYHPATVYSSIDRNGRYAYANQPRIAHWNLSRLAGALLPLFDADKDEAVTIAQAALDRFPEIFEAAYLAGLRRKLGLAEAHDGDAALAQELLDCMAEGKADFTLTFRRLSDSAASGDNTVVRTVFDDPAAFDIWFAKWRARLELEALTPAERAAVMRSANPAFIPRNHRIQAVITAAQAGDFSVFNELMVVLAKPYQDQPEFARYAEPPQPEEVVRQTFCGT